MSTGRHARLLFREAVAFARETMLFHRVKPADRHHDEDPALTVFVHGLYATGGVLLPISNFLAKRGVARRQIHFAYPPLRTIHAVAVSLGETIEATGHRGPVHIVGHSLGGLIGRYYRQILGGRLDRLVCLATPHSGTDAARRFTAIPLASEINPDSHTIDLLHRTRDRLAGTRVCSIIANSDQMVRPVHHAGLVGHEIVEFDDIAHHSILFDARVWEHAARVLAEPIVAAREHEAYSAPLMATGG